MRFHRSELSFRTDSLILVLDLEQGMSSYEVDDDAIVI